MSDISRQLGQNLHKIRKSKKLSQEQLAELSGLTKNYIGLLERGQRNPSVETLSRIAVALNILIKDLFHFGLSREND